MPDPDHLPGRLDARYRAFLETLTQLRPKLHRYCARMTGSALDGEDVVQDALLDAYRRLDTWDDSRPIGPWLFRIAHNRCVDFLRKRHVRTEAEDAIAEPPVTAMADPPGPALGRAVEHLVHHLPPKERASVLLKDVFDYTLEEIAELTESTTGGVKAALHRGRQKLQALEPPVATRSAPAMEPATERLLRLYVERFNRQDWDGLRTLITADATLRVADLFEGPMRESPYFARYAALPAPLFAELSEVDGQPAIVLQRVPLNGAPGASLRVFIRIQVEDGRIVHVTDYTHCPWMFQHAGHVSPLRAHA